MRGSGSELIDETVGPLLVIVVGPAHVSSNNFDSVGSSLLNCTNSRLSIGNAEMHLLLNRADCS